MHVGHSLILTIWLPCHHANISLYVCINPHSLQQIMSGHSVSSTRRYLHSSASLRVLRYTFMGPDISLTINPASFVIIIDACGSRGRGSARTGCTSLHSFVN